MVRSGNCTHFPLLILIQAGLSVSYWGVISRASCFACWQSTPQILAVLPINIGIQKSFIKWQVGMSHFRRVPWFPNKQDSKQSTGVNLKLETQSKLKTWMPFYASIFLLGPVDGGWWGRVIVHMVRAWFAWQWAIERTVCSDIRLQKTGVFSTSCWVYDLSLV